jgi:hypothetical protein
MSTKPMLCARCRIQVQVTPNPMPTDTVICPECGESDTFENVKRSLAEQAQEYFVKRMQSTLGDAFRGSQNIKYTPGTIPKRHHRFVIELGS